MYNTGVAHGVANTRTNMKCLILAKQDYIINIQNRFLLILVL